MKIISYQQTCEACPSQWDGFLEDGRMFYIRYRYGWGEVKVSDKPTRNIFDAVNGEVIFTWSILGEENQLDGSIEEEALRELTQHIFEWPEIEVEEAVGGENETAW